MLFENEINRISENLDKRGVARFGVKGRAEVRDGLVYIDGDSEGFENPMTFDTFRYHFLPKVLERGL